jgi:hypothetical protein
MNKLEYLEYLHNNRYIHVELRGADTILEFAAEQGTLDCLTFLVEKNYKGILLFYLFFYSVSTSLIML